MFSIDLNTKFTFFLSKLGTESRITGTNRQDVIRRDPPRPLIIPNGRSITIEMEDGSIYAGLTRQRQIFRFPTWITEEHEGSLEIFIQTTNNIGYFVSHVFPLQNRHNNIGRMRAHIRLEGNNSLQVDLDLMGNALPPRNARARVYIGLPDGRTFTGYVMWLYQKFEIKNVHRVIVYYLIIQNFCEKRSLYNHICLKWEFR